MTVGLFTHPEIEDADPLGLIDIFSLDRGQRLATKVLAPFSWSPSRAQLLAIAPNRADFALVRIDAESNRTQTVATNAAFDFAWLGNGDSIAYLTSESDEHSLWVVDADGGDARLLARKVDHRIAASADGERIAFGRPAKNSFRHELWIVDVETGDQRRVPGPLLPDTASGGDVWLDQETLVVHDFFPGAGSDEPDALRVDVGSGARSLFAADTQVLEMTRNGSSLLATRRVPIRDDPDSPGMAVVTMKIDGTGARVVAVTDSFLGQVPVRQPAERELEVAESLAPPRGLEQQCRSKLIELRARARRG
jgi:hypothetical protein